MVDVVDRELAEPAPGAEQISIRQIVGETFQFVGRNFLGILSRIALPVLGIWVVLYLSLSFYLMELASFLRTHSEQEASLILGGFVGGLLLLLFLNAIAVVAVCECVLSGGGEHSPRFRVALPEWRLFAASLRFVPVAMGLLVIYVIGAHILSTSGEGRVLDVLWGTLTVGAATYLGVRLCFLMGPVTVCEKGAILRRGWALSANHQLRILAVFAALTVPLILTEMAGEVVMRQMGVTSQLMTVQSLSGLVGVFGKVLPEFVVLGGLTYAVGVVFLSVGAVWVYRGVRSAS